MPPVRLRPLLGVAPGTYLTAALAFLSLLALFVVLILPGLLFDGTVLRLATTPSGAAIHVDGQFVGTTPAEVRVDRGEHAISLSRPYLRTIEFPFPAAGRLVGSWLAPRRLSQHLHMEVVDTGAMLDDALADYAASPLLAPALSHAVRAISGSDSGSFEDYSPFVHNLIHHATSQALFDAVMAATRALSVGSPVSATGIARFVSFVLQSAQELANSPALLAAAAPGKIRARIVPTPWFQSWRASAYEALLEATATERPPARRSLVVGALTFREVPATTFVMGDTSRVAGFAQRTAPAEEMPHVVAVPRFFAGVREVSKRDFADFVAANPRWAPSNRSALVAEGLVTADYLGDWADGRPRPEALDLPVTYVSFHAAQAFATWVGEHPSVRGAGLVARLPHEPEWELSARGGLPDSRYPTGSEARTARVGTPRGGPAPAGFSAPNGYGLQDTLGNVWEWTGDWYAPNTYYLRRSWELDYGDDLRLRVGAERVVRGGSFVNELSSLAVHTRGTQPPEWCTPVLGFRLVLANP